MRALIQHLETNSGDLEVCDNSRVFDMVNALVGRATSVVVCLVVEYNEI